MHLVHLTPEDLKKHPWLGVLIGLVGMILFTFLSLVAARDFINFSNQKTPLLINVEKLETHQPFTRKWVTLTNFRLDCEQAEKTRRTDPIEKFFEGSVYDTYVTITNSSRKELIVAIFHGDIACPKFQSQPLTGILTTTDDYSYGVAFLSTKLSKTTAANLILRVDEGLGQSQTLLAISILFDIASLLFIVMSSRLWLQKWEAEHE
jgi:hypothetical protein